MSEQITSAKAVAKTVRIAPRKASPCCRSN